MFSHLYNVSINTSLGDGPPSPHLNTTEHVLILPHLFIATLINASSNFPTHCLILSTGFTECNKCIRCFDCNYAVSFWKWYTIIWAMSPFMLKQGIVANWICVYIHFTNKFRQSCCFWMLLLHSCLYTTNDVYIL